jgi:hypothetical protein
MAGFELTRIGPVGDIAREWRAARMVPLYLAGIAVGVAAGVAVSIQTGEGAAKPLHLPAASAPVVAPVEPAWQLAPSFSPGVCRRRCSGACRDPGVDAPVRGDPVIEPSSYRCADDVPAAAASAATLTADVAPAAAAPVPVTEAAPAPVPQPAPAAKADFYVPAVPAAGPPTSNSGFRWHERRTRQRAAPFVYDAGLTKVARTRSQQMADRAFAHVDPFDTHVHGAVQALWLRHHAGWREP